MRVVPRNSSSDLDSRRFFNIGIAFLRDDYQKCSRGVWISVKNGFLQWWRSELKWNGQAMLRMLQKFKRILLIPRRCRRLMNPLMPISSLQADWFPLFPCQSIEFLFVVQIVSEEIFSVARRISITTSSHQRFIGQVSFGGLSHFFCCAMKVYP